MKRSIARCGHATRAKNYEQALGEVCERNPTDDEATIFHALQIVAIGYLDPDPGRVPDTMSWEELRAHRAPLAFEAVAFDHPLWILFSSGTTQGRPSSCSRAGLRQRAPVHESRQYSSRSPHRGRAVPA